MEYFYSRLRARKLNQRGINMVDLMMWLVIAALLLAAALQGVGYYRQSASLYTMKSDAMHAGEAVTAKASQNGGEYSAQTVADATNESAKSRDVAITPDAGASDSAGFVLRATHPEIINKDVLFLSSQRGGYAPGINVVPKGTVIAPNGSTSIPDPSDGSGDGTGTTTGATFTPVMATSTCDPDVARHMNASLAFLASPLYLESDIAYSIGDNDTGDAKFDELWYGPIGVEDETTGTAEVVNKMDILTNRTDIDITALNEAKDNTRNSYFDASPPTVELQQAMVTAENNLYTVTCSAPFDWESRYLVAAPSFPQNFTDVTITPGTHDVVFRVAVPASYTGSTLLPYISAGSNNGEKVFVDPDVKTDGGTSYWEITYSGNDNGTSNWVTGTNTVTIYVGYMSSPSHPHFKTFTITVQ